MLTAILRLLATSRHADFEVVCKGHVFRVHKAILAAASGYYDRLCDSGFIEGSAARSTLDEDPAIVARMLIFAYTQTYHTEALQADKMENAQFKAIKDPYGDQSFNEKSFDWETRARLHAMLYALSDKYELISLKHQARQRFLIAFSEVDEYSNICDDVVNDVKGYWPEEYKSSWAKNAAVCQVVYETTPHNDRGLRDMLVDYILSWIREDELKDLCEANAVLSSTEMMQVIAETRDLAFDLAIMRHSIRQHACEICKEEIDCLASRCGCGKYDTCTEDGCLRQAQIGSFCCSCKRLGTTVLVKDTAEDKAAQ